MTTPRVPAVRAVLLAVALVCGLGALGLALRPDDLPPAGGAGAVAAATHAPDPDHGSDASVPPGLRKDVQRWMAARDGPLVRLNDALVPLVSGPARDVRAGPAECRELDASLRALKRVGPAPDHEVDALAAAGLDQVARAARACLGGDLVRARRLALRGLDRRAAASLALAEALEGE